MDENNPIEGLDPSQSAFEPLMDQTMPEGVQGMRTTTTTTMYISGAPSPFQIEGQNINPIFESIKATYEILQPKQVVDDSGLRVKVEQILQDPSVSSLPNDERKLRKVRDILSVEDPQGEWRDERFDDKINLTKRFPDLFPNYSAYTADIENRTLYKGEGVDKLISDRRINEYATNTFSYLWDASGIGAKNAEDYGRKVAYEKNVFNVISSEDKTIDDLKRLGNISNIKKIFPDMASGIENMNVKDAMQGSLSIEQLEKLKEENPTQKEVIDAKIKKEKSIQNSKTLLSYMTDDELIEYTLGGYKELPKEYIKLLYEREIASKDNFVGSGFSLEDIIHTDFNITPFIDKYLEKVLPFSESLGVDPRAFSEAIVLDENQLKDFKKSQSQQTELLESINKQIMLIGKDALAIEDLQDIYMYGQYAKSNLAKFKEIDDSIWGMTEQIVNPKGLFDLPELFYKKHGTSKSEFINKREIILEFADRPMDIVNNMYSPEKIDKMYEISKERMIKNVGSEELDLFYYITGGNKLTDYYDEDIRSGSKSNNQDILNRIHVNDETKTVTDLNQLFKGTPFRFREAATGYDAVEIYTVVKDEYGQDYEMNSSGAIFIDDDKNYNKFISWMAKANPTASDKRFIGERKLPNEDYGNPTIFRLTDKPVGYDEKGKMFSYMYKMQNIDRFSMGGGESSINIDAASAVTDNLLANSWISDDLLNRFKAIKDNAINIDYQRKSLMEASELDVGASAIVSGFSQGVKYLSNLQSDIMVSLASDDMLGISFDRYMFDLDGKRRTISEAKDLYLKDIKRQNNRNFENLRKNASGVQKEWLNENAGIIAMTTNFLLESAAVGISGGAAARSVFFMYAANGIEDQMLSREFDGLTEWEKKLISVPYGFVIGELEKLGFETSLGAFSNNTFGEISRYIIKDALKNIPKDASREVIETAIKNSVKGKIIDAGVRFTAGGFSEGSVEAIQSVAEVGIQEITNYITNLEYFDTPKLNTYEGVKEMLSEMGASFGYGAIGGHVMSAGGMAINGVRTGTINAKDNKKFKGFYDVISDEKMLENAKSMVLYRMQNGDLDKEQANAEIDALDKMYSISQEIPTDLNTNQTHQAFDLLSEKRKIQEGIEGKQENLVKEQKERLKDIDRQLELISKGGYKDAIQEQKTDEEVLPAEGPEVGLQEVDLQEVTITEQATEEEALKSIQEENKVREKNNATPIPETEQEISKRKEELNQEKQTLKEQGEASIQETKRKEKIKKRKEEEAKQDPYKQAVEKIEEKKREIKPETSSNYANLTEDDEGNVVIYHIGPSPENMDKDSDGDVVIKPTSGKTKATSREESSALSKVGGLADFYTQESDEESMVTGDAKYAVKVPKSKVYDFNSDPEGFIEEARRRHEKEYPGMAFDANTQLAYVSQVASENGYDVVVSEWDGRTRAQSVKELKVSDTKIKEGNRVTKEFDNTYKSNKDKGYESVIPADKDDQLEDVYMKIKNEKGDNKEYDETYFLFDSRRRKKNYNQEQITKMVNESNLSQEIKDEYNAVMEAKPEQRRSEKVRDNVAGVDIKYPTAQEEQQRKEERTKPEYVDDAANKNQTEDVESFQKELEGEFGMLTGENPLGKPLTEQENQQLNQKAEEWLKKKGYKPRRVTGKYGQAENSFFVPGLTKEDAIAFANEFNQESVAHSDGMIFQDGTMNPRVKSNDNFTMDEYTPESNMVSVIKTDDGLKTFSVGYDFESVAEAIPKPKPKKSPAKKMKQRVDRIMKQVDNAKKAISKIIPGVEIVTHKDEDSYRKATGETDSKKQTSRGEYNPKTKKIHINLSKANNRTVAHEVFHAILLSRLKTEKAAKDLTERMIKSLSKSDQLENIKMTFRGEEITLAEYLEKFASNYDENIQSEEKLAELAGVLAENYGQLGKTNKNLIKRFLDRLAKMFGLKPFTDNEVVDVLNTIAGKVTVGEEIADVDLKVIPQSVVDEKMSDATRKQAEDLFLSKDKPKLKSTKDVAEWLENWSKENKVFDKEVKDLSDSEIVDKFADHITLELTAWEKVRKDDYVSFYDNDIVEKTNPILQEYAKKEYGRPLTDAEVKLYHLVSAFASPSANPEMDSWKGFDIFDRFMKTGELSGYSDKIATEWEWTTSKTGKEVRKDTGRPRLDKEGKPMRSKVTPAYSQTGLDKFNTLMDEMGGDIDMAMDWITSEHSYKEISDMFGFPEKGPKALKQNEYMSKEDGGIGVFGMTGAKLGSYILNRFGNFSTVTKDMWYARTMARLAGQDLVTENKKTKKKGAVKTPWSESTKEGRRMRGLADKAFQEVAKTFETSSAMIQERIWDFEKRMYEMLGANEDAAYTSDGLKKGIERAKDTPSKRKQIVIGENADLKQNVKDFLLQANDMEAQGESREDIRIVTGWERGADNKWGYELSDFIDIDLDNIQTNKLYNIEDIVTYPEIFEAYNDAKKLKIRFIDNPRKSGMAAYYAKKGLIEVNLSKINLSEYVEENMIKSKLAQNPEVLAAATREANALIKQSELEKRGVKRNSLEWNTEMQSVYPDVQNLIDIKTINDYRNKNNVSYSDFFKDVRMIERSILNKSEIDLDKGKNELNSKVLHELQHAIGDLAGFPRGGSASNIQLTFTEQEKKEYNEIVKEVARMSKLYKEGKIDDEQYLDAKYKKVEYRYRKYNELAGEAMSINAEKRMKLSPQERREKTLESTMNVNIQDQKLLYEEEKNIAIKEKKVEDKKKPEERRGIFDMFKKRKQKGDANMEEAIQRALMKFELSAERGNTRSQAIKSAIADLRKNDWYKSATDIQRDEAVRDIKENFGIKSKKGPSTRKVLGQQKRTKITVTLDQMAEYKKQIKEWNRSARLAKKDLNTRRKELGALVKSMVKGGIMTSKQAAILVERASKINLENEVIVNRFVEYAQKVFENAEYAQKFQEAISLRRKIKKNLRRDNQAEVIAMGKKFADIDPQMVEDIDAYIEYADQMYEALRASRIKGLEVDFSQAANLAEMSDFYDEAIANQNKILKKEMIAKYQELGLTEDMSIEEIREIVNAIEGNEVVEGKEKEILSLIQKRFGVMTAIAKDMIGRGVNPFTGESIDITEHQKDMIKRMIKADISKMDIKNAIKFVEYMDNFITNEITSGLESAISIYEGEMSIVELMKSKVRGRMPKLGLSEAMGELWNRQLTSLPVLFDRIFQGTNRGLKVMQKIGVQEIMNGKAKKTSAHNKIMQEYSKKFIDGDKSFMNAENVYERGMVAFMSRNIVGTQAEQKMEFERRKKLVAESIETLEKSKNRKERNKAKVYREVYNRLGIMTATDIASIKSKSSAKNLASVNWWTDQWADKYSDLADVSLSVYNTILGTDTNYTPDKYKVLSKRTDISRREVEEAANKTGAFMSGTHIDRNKSGVLMETTRPKALPKGRYVSFDFDIDNFNSMDKALTDIYTASAIQKFYGASQSSDFDEVFGDTAGLIRDRVASYIKKMKGRDEFTGNKEFNKVLNTVAKFGVSKALGGVSQALKQTFPVMANTLVNAGRFDFAQREDLTWVNESMMSIANRGIEAETAIDSADSKIDVNTSDTLRSIGKKIDSLQGMYLKAFLQAPDVYVAKSSFISYYKQYMKRKGLSTELNQGEYNQDALEYAQMMVDRQQNISDNDLAGEFLSGSRFAMTRKVVAPFASFVLNQKARMMADLRVLNPANKAVTNEDRKAAAKSLTGLMVELTIFHTMSAVIREAFKMAAKGLFGDDDDDDKEEDEWGSLESNKKIWAAGKYAISSVIKDILSPFPAGGDMAVDAGINELIDMFDINLADEDDVQKAVDAENEIRLLNREDPMSKKEISELRKSIMEQGEIKVWEDEAFLKDLGVLTIGPNTIKDLNDAYNFYKDGYYVDDRGGKEKKRYILDRDKEDLGFVVFGKLMTAIGLAPKDVGDIARYGLKEFKKETISEKKYDKYTEIKKEIKREPTDGELYLILNSGQDVKNVVKDIEILKKHFGGLTEKEAKEYLKLKDYKLSPSKFKIEEIKKGKTAEQIAKERDTRIKETGDPILRL